MYIISNLKSGVGTILMNLFQSGFSREAEAIRWMDGWMDGQTDRVDRFILKFDSGNCGDLKGKILEGRPAD